MTKNLGFAPVAALSGAWKPPRHIFARVRGPNATPTLTRRPRHFHRSRAARPAPRPLLREGRQRTAGLAGGRRGGGTAPGLLFLPRRGGQRRRPIGGGAERRPPGERPPPPAPPPPPP